VHGARLHGFALLVAAGDAARARQAAAEALEAGAAQAARLRHPERAAAWLRHALVTLRRGRLGKGLSEAVRQAALAELGVGMGAYRALGQLSLEQRAAVVASAIEGLAAIDLETIMGAPADRSRRLATDGLRRYLAAMAPTLPVGLAPAGPLARRIRAAADLALGVQDGASG
jgi:DNA-directed RNA polymerase specialized sigma24 family protein